MQPANSARPGLLDRKLRHPREHQSLKRAGCQSSHCACSVDVDFAQAAAVRISGSCSKCGPLSEEQVPQ